MRRKLRWYSNGSSATTTECRYAVSFRRESQTSGEGTRLTVVVILCEHIVDAFHLLEVQLCVTVVLLCVLRLVLLLLWLELLLFALVDERGGDRICGSGSSELWRVIVQFWWICTHALARAGRSCHVTPAPRLSAEREEETRLSSCSRVASSHKRVLSQGCRGL